MRSLRGVLLLIGLVWMSSHARAGATESPLRVTLSAERTDLLEHEPLKMTVEIRNVSDHPVNVASIQDINMYDDMRFTLVEVSTGKGRAELREGAVSTTDVDFGSGYRGDSLPPGGLILFNIYPNVTYRFERTSNEEARQALDKPGNYTVRVVYHIPSDVRLLPPGPGGMVFSNAVLFQVRKPTRQEKEILDAMWTGSAANSDYERGAFDEKKLRSVIDKYPDLRLIAYAKFSLARSLAGRAPVDAQAIYRDLMKKYPHFRDEEVHVQMGYAAINARDYKLALDTMTELLSRRPELQNTYEVGHRYLWAKTQGVDAVSRWLEARRLGKTVDLLSMQ